MNLFAEVIPSESKHDLLSTKVEIKLKKAAPGFWPKLGEDASGSEGSASIGVPADSSSERPSYPTSTLRWAWDRLSRSFSLQAPKSSALSTC